MGDLLTYYIYCEETKKVFSRSSIRSADPHRGGIINKCLDPNYEPDEASPEDASTSSSSWEIKGQQSIIDDKKQQQTEPKPRRSPRFTSRDNLHPEPVTQVRRSSRLNANILKGEPRQDSGENNITDEPISYSTLNKQDSGRISYLRIQGRI